MNAHLEAAITAIQKRCKAETQEFRGETTLLVKPELHIEAARALRDEFEFNMLLDETAVDYFPQENPRFHIVYHVYSMSQNLVLRVRVPLDGSHLRSQRSKRFTPMRTGRNVRFGHVWHPL